ncbi:MAG: phosphatidate cytidylyltransferase [Rhodospirillales bacterium]|nr:phosphatidate cytidylyltransferase [Rhodospirillales bacterium]
MGRVLASPAPGPGIISSPWGDLRLRLISGLVLAPLALAAIWFGGFAFAVMVLIAAIGVAIEWSLLCRARPGWVVAASGGVGWIALAVFGALWLRADPAAGRANIAFLVVGVWGSDIGAYLAGRAIGGRKLAPAISPGKTWAGAAGGLVGAAAFGTVIVVAHGLGPGAAELGRAALLAVLVSVLGQVGDLAESWAKRHFGVKDSSHLIPGHGGLLDRLDAALAVLPPAALLAYWLGPGVVLWR